jgi:hypothetical protein
MEEGCLVQVTCGRAAVAAGVGQVARRVGAGEEEGSGRMGCGQ